MALEKEVTARGVDKIYLGTTEFFKAAYRFYERNGYLEISMSELPADFPIMKIDTIFFVKIKL